MSQIIKIYGEVSQKEITAIEVTTDETLDLLNLLRKHKVPIASSCYGEGVCQKCIINNSILSCQMTVRDFLKRSDEYHNIIKISYL